MLDLFWDTQSAQELNDALISVFERIEELWDAVSDLLACYVDDLELQSDTAKRYEFVSTVRWNTPIASTPSKYGYTSGFI